MRTATERRGFFSVALLSTDGFTLLEVMIALAAAGGLLVTLIYTLNYHLGIAERHRFVTVATMLAKSKMAEVRHAPARISGEFQAPYAGYRYRTEMRASRHEDMTELSVIVGDGNEELSITALVDEKAGE